MIDVATAAMGMSLLASIPIKHLQPQCAEKNCRKNRYENKHNQKSHEYFV